MATADLLCIVKLLCREHPKNQVDWVLKQGWHLIRDLSTCKYKGKVSQKWLDLELLRNVTS